MKNYSIVNRICVCCGKEFFANKYIIKDRINNNGFDVEYLCKYCYFNLKTTLKFKCKNCEIEVNESRMRFTRRSFDTDKELCFDCHIINKKNECSMTFLCDSCNKEFSMYIGVFNKRDNSRGKFCSECYKKKVSQVKKLIRFTCIECGCESVIQKFKDRTVSGTENICQTCYKEKYYCGPVSESYYPSEIKDIYRDKVWDYDRVCSFFDIIKSKKLIRFICDICGDESEMTLNSMKRRKICGTKKICKKCALKYALSSDLWVKNNSGAQFIAQNRPDVLEKQRLAQNNLMERDPLYCEKRRSKSYVSGEINGMHFDSSWELFFIVYCLERKDLEYIKRYNGYLLYKDDNGVDRRYFPDFILKIKDHPEQIIEIKGRVNNRCCDIKCDVANNVFGERYMMYDEKSLYSIGLRVRSEIYQKSLYLHILREYVVKFSKNKTTDKLMEKIKSWQK